MCTILFAYRHVPGYPLVIAANRDEFYERPTRGIHWWEDQPDLLAGRDLREGGTWFGITRGGRFATLTNYREVGNILPDAPSRGHLVRDFLTGVESLKSFSDHLHKEGSRYNGFNLLYGEGGDLYYYANRSGKEMNSSDGAGGQSVSPGIHGLSNHLLNSPWPKVNKGKTQLANWIDRYEPAAAASEALDWLSNPAAFPDEELPDTGVGLERERMLSSLFIQSPMYGTRASWVLTLADDGTVRVSEKSHVPDEAPSHFRFSARSHDSL